MESVAHCQQGRGIRQAAIGLLAGLLLAPTAAPASAERLDNEVAIFAALDKVTARISKLEVRLNETRRFGSLEITPRVCYSRPPTAAPKTSTFVEVDEIQLDGEEDRLFTGWMFAESPGLNAVEHPVYDVWLTGCAEPLTSVSEGGSRSGPDSAASGRNDTIEPPRRRVRR